MENPEQIFSQKDMALIVQKLIKEGRMPHPEQMIKAMEKNLPLVKQILVKEEVASKKDQTPSSKKKIRK